MSSAIQSTLWVVFVTNNKPVTIWEALGLVWELLFLIAVPATLLALAGRWIDARFSSAPWATLAGLFLALLASAFVARRKGLAIASRLKDRSE